MKNFALALAQMNLLSPAQWINSKILLLSFRGFRSAMSGTPKRIDPERLELLKARTSSSLSPDHCALWQVFFGELLDSEHFIDDRRKLLRKRAGIPDKDKHRRVTSSISSSHLIFK